MQYQIEVTDTFGGQPNYSWVKRAVINAPEPTDFCSDKYNAKAMRKAQDKVDRIVMRRAKAAVSLNGVRCRKFDHGDMIELRPNGACIVAFITCIY